MATLLLVHLVCGSLRSLSCPLWVDVEFHRCSALIMEKEVWDPVVGELPCVEAFSSCHQRPPAGTHPPLRIPASVASMQGL